VIWAQIKRPKYVTLNLPVHLEAHA
jgi:hypothetical protein